jgi:hypothetical protein
MVCGFGGKQIAKRVRIAHPGQIVVKDCANMLEYDAG